jgi:hypothetical protein
MYFFSNISKRFKVLNLQRRGDKIITHLPTSVSISVGVSTSVGRARWLGVSTSVGRARWVGVSTSMGRARWVGVSTSMGRASGWVCLPVWVGQEGGCVY